MPRRQDLRGREAPGRPKAGTHLMVHPLPIPGTGRNVTQRLPLGGILRGMPVPYQVGAAHGDGVGGADLPANKGRH